LREEKARDDDSMMGKKAKKGKFIEGPTVRRGRKKKEKDYSKKPWYPIQRGKRKADSTEGTNLR